MIVSMIREVAWKVLMTMLRSVVLEQVKGAKDPPKMFVITQKLYILLL